MDLQEFLQDPILLSNLDSVQYQYFYNLLNHRTIILNNDVDETLIENVVIPLLNFEKDDSQEPVNLLINTCGGRMHEGLLLCNIIDAYKKPLNITVLSYAYSMGTIIMCAGTKNPNIKRRCYPFSTFLIHAGEGGAVGETNVVRDLISFQDAMDKRLKDYVVSNTKITLDEYEKHERKQWFLTAQEALEKNLVDEVI